MKQACTSPYQCAKHFIASITYVAAGLLVRSGNTRKGIAALRFCPKGHSWQPPQKQLLAALLSFLLKRSRSLAPLSRMSMAYPLTFRFRTQVTITLLSSISFLIMLLLTNNLGQAQQGQVQVTSGNFQLEIELTQDQRQQYVAQQLHMSKAQIKTKLQARIDLIAIAEQQGISATQLRAILLEAEQKGHTVLVQGGYLTQQQSDAGMQDLRTRTLQTLSTSIKYDFLDH